MEKNISLGKCSDIVLTPNNGIYDYRYGLFLLDEDWDAFSWFDFLDWGRHILTKLGKQENAVLSFMKLYAYILKERYHQPAMIDEEKFYEFVRYASRYHDVDIELGRNPIEFLPAEYQRFNSIYDFNINPLFVLPGVTDEMLCRKVVNWVGEERYVCFVVPIVGVQHKLVGQKNRDFYESGYLGKKIRLSRDVDNMYDSLAVRATYTDDEGNQQVVGWVSADYVVRVNRILENKLSIAGSIESVCALNGKEEEIPVGTIFVGIYVPAEYMCSDIESETISHFQGVSQKLLTIPPMEEEHNLRVLCEEICETDKVDKLVKLAKQYLNHMDISLASDDRADYLRIERHLSSFGVGAIREVLMEIQSKRHHLISDHIYSVYQKQMAHVREKNLVSRFCNVYSEEEQAEIRMAIKRILFSTFEDTWMDDESFAKCLYYARYSQKDLYCIYTHKILAEMADNDKNNHKSVNTQHSFVTDQNKSKAVISKIILYQQNKSTPKDLAMPLRAAIDAGVIRRPTFGEYDSVKGFAKISKSSFTNYTSPDNIPYIDEAYNAIVEEFKAI